MDAAIPSGLGSQLDARAGPAAPAEERAAEIAVERTVALNATPDVPPALARARARVGLAVFRGLLLDLVGTGDQAGVDAAFEAFAALSAEAPETSTPAMQRGIP